MLIVDRALAAGIRFVLDKVSVAAERDATDPAALRERLLELQLRHDLGEVGAEELAREERELLARLRSLDPEAGERNEALAIGERSLRVEISAGGDEGDLAATRPATRRRRGARERRR